MLKIITTIVALTVAAVAARRTIRAKQGNQPNLQGDGAAHKATAKAKQSLENAKENVQDMAEMAKDKVREKA